MLTIPLLTVPNQTFSVTLDNNFYNITIRQIADTQLMAMDITINNADVINSLRLMPNTPIIPYSWLAQQGNFVFLTENGDYPYYENFNLSQQLVYATLDEINSATAN